MKYRRLFLFTLLLALFPLVSTTASVASTTLEKIQHTVLTTGEEQVVFEFNGPSKTKKFTLQGERPRLVFDFKNVKPSSTLGNRISINSPLIDKIRIGIHHGDTVKTRVVIDMVADSVFTHNVDLNQENKTLAVTISPDRESAPPQVATSRQAPSRPTGRPTSETTPAATPLHTTSGQLEEKPQKQRVEPVHANRPAQASPPKVIDEQKEQPTLKALTYKRDAGKGEMVLFKLNGFYPPIVYGVEEGLPRAVCDFKKTLLTTSVKSITETKGEYVRSIRVGKHVNPDKVRVVIDLEPNNNYDLQQVFFKKDNLFVIIVNTVHNNSQAN